MGSANERRRYVTPLSLAEPIARMFPVVVYSVGSFTKYGCLILNSSHSTGDLAPHHKQVCASAS